MKLVRNPFVVGLCCVIVGMLTPGIAEAAAPNPDVIGCTPQELVIITSNVSHQTVVYQTFFTGPAVGTATEMKTYTQTFSVSASVGGQADFIFGSLNGQISGGISQSLTANYGSTYQVTVAKGVTTYVAYVSRYDAISGYTTNQSSTCQESAPVYFTATAPTTNGWIQSSSPITSN